MSENHADVENTGDEVIKSIGALEEASSQLDVEDCDEVEIDPEEAGKWITAIGKALLAIFKP